MGLDLDSYMKKQYSMESTKDKCSFCHVRFTTKQTMKAHYQRAHFRIFSGIHVYSCGKCDFETGNETSFLHHKAALLDCTSGMICIKCEKCDQMFTTMKKCCRTSEKIMVKKFSLNWICLYLHAFWRITQR